MKMKQYFCFCFVLCLLLLCAVPAFAQGDGMFQYQAAPNGGSMRNADCLKENRKIAP